MPYGTDAERAGHPHRPRDQQQAERLGEAEPRAGQPPERERGQRHGRQADDLDQREEAERFGATQGRRLVGDAAGSLGWDRMSTYERVADLPLKIDEYALEGLTAPCPAGSSA